MRRREAGKRAGREGGGTEQEKSWGKGIEREETSQGEGVRESGGEGGGREQRQRERSSSRRHEECSPTQCAPRANCSPLDRKKI